MSDAREKHAYSWRRFLLYFLRLGALGFGGPIALAGYMQRDLVEARGWIGEREYAEGLALAQLSPGPLAAQLAIYLGWVRGRVLGAAAVSVAFIGPSFLMVLALAAGYLRYGGLPWMAGAFYGIGAAVIAIISKSSFNLLKKTLQRDRVLWGVALVNALSTALTESEIVALIVGGGVASLLFRRSPTAPPSSRGAPLRGVIPALLLTGVKGPAATATVWKLFWYFASAGVFVFGSGLAIVPFLHGGVVTTHGWLDERQFLDSVAVAMITPGPVVITVAFIGYLVAGPIGATLAALGVFLPCFVITVAAAPHFHRLASRPRIKTFVEGVTAAAVGAIAGAVFVLGKKSVVDGPTIVVALGALLVLTKFKRVPEPILILVAGVLGIAWHLRA